MNSEMAPAGQLEVQPSPPVEATTAPLTGTLEDFAYKCARQDAFICFIRPAQLSCARERARLKSLPRRTLVAANTGVTWQR